LAQANIAENLCVASLRIAVPFAAVLRRESSVTRPGYQGDQPAGRAMDSSFPTLAEPLN
jgi:hypothetical protein